MLSSNNRNSIIFPTKMPDRLLYCKLRQWVKKPAGLRRKSRLIGRGRKRRQRPGPGSWRRRAKWCCETFCAFSPYYFSNIVMMIVYADWSGGDAGILFQTSGGRNRCDEDERATGSITACIIYLYMYVCIYVCMYSM